MPAGFQVFNSAGVLQVDQDTFNLTLKQKGTGTFSSTVWGTATVSFFTFTVTGLKNPVLAVMLPTAAYVRTTMKNNGSGSFTFYVYSASAAVGSSLTYFVFDSTDVVAPADNFGVQVFNSAGTQTYHSSAKPMRVVAAMSSYTSVTLASGRTYAVVCCSYEFRFDNTNLGPSTYSNLSFFSAASINSNVVTTQLENYESYGTTTSQPSKDIGSPYFLVVDVTNY